MHTQEEIFARFPELSQEIREKLMLFAELLKKTNARVNLISRKDEDDIAYRHVAFCLSICKFLTPNKGARIADVGTGGGLPGIVMAIVWPQAEIFMFDGVGRKIEAISQIIKELGLKNAVAKKARIEETKEVFDYATGRSVCALPMFFNFVKKSIRKGKAGSLENGVIYFKGGELEEELVKKNILPDKEMKLDEFFEDKNYEGKRLLHFKFFKR
ncbi:16S rRNA (guanine(527)-N(7))-methyltransferase RsmG [Intestinicryptomonas porci]|uniref:Ribosomal RNA small subunit methyltransferase G n=1 Tax=Intestinicryptomonas porci TaxID=2926320 RepID=A0ABU4WFE4_9BACT|nr:16S rRNA (guanine(527)-N(7))-methyltransferase RsmG [Opitutales bacterium CLA-KB-P66]